MINVIIRLAEKQELDDIMRIFACAQKYMAENGNPTQWGNTHPSRELIRDDIEKGILYVGQCDDGKIHCAFALIGGIDPTYVNIYDGKWLNEDEYLTVHRIASDGVYHGIFKECMDFCKTKCDNIRIDTHEDNKTMRHVLNKNGFVYCGVIYLENGEPRIAYQFAKG